MTDPTDNQEQIDALAEVIEAFLMVKPGEDDREWSSTEMATAILKAGYIKPDLEVQ